MRFWTGGYTARSDGNATGIGILTAGAVLERAPGPLLFVIGAAAVLLIVVGIHNAWDTVKYIVLLGWEKRSETRNETRRGKDEWS